MMLQLDIGRWLAWDLGCPWGGVEARGEGKGKKGSRRRRCQVCVRVINYEYTNPMHNYYVEML